MEDKLKESREYHRNTQDKYIYYISGLSTVAIGYIISFEFNGKYSELTELLKFIPISLLSYSIYNGIKFSQNKMSMSFKDHELIRIKEGMNEITGNDESKIKIGIKTLMTLINNEDQQSKKYYNRQYCFLFFGAISFFLLHFLSTIISII